MATDYYPRIESDQKFQEIEKKIAAISAGSFGPITPATAATFTTDGFATAAETGDYVFAQGTEDEVTITVTALDLTNAVVKINKKGAIYSKEVIPLGFELPIPVKPSSANSGKPADAAEVAKFAEPQGTKTIPREAVEDQEGDSFEVIDQNGNVVARIDSKGLQTLSVLASFSESDAQEFDIVDPDGRSIFKANENGITITDLIAKTGELIICDGEGKVIFKVSNEGVQFAGQNTGGGSNTALVKEGNSLADIVQIIVYGQSLSVGGSATSAIDFYNAKQFNGGILTNYDPDDTTARDNYYGSGLVDLSATGTETPGKGFVRAYKDAVLALNGIAIEDQDFELLVNAPGAGGISLAACANTEGIYYRRLIESVQQAHDFAIASGKSHVVGALTFWQSENSADTQKSEQQYFDECTAMFTSINNDVKAITGQNQDVQFIVYQVATYENNALGTPGPALAFLKMAREVLNITLAPVMYAYDYTDDYHVTGASTRQGGACAGLAAAKTIFNSDKPEPMYPIAHSISENSAGTAWVISLDIPVMVPPLVIDTITVPEADNYGFSILNGSDAETITDVTVRRNGITIITNEDPTGRLLTYCIEGVANPGNIRDSQDYEISHNGSNYSVYNWLPIFQYSL